MKRTNNNTARSIRVRTVVAYPAVTVALVVSIALALTPFGTSQVMALDAPATSTQTTASTATATDTPSPTPTGTPDSTATDTPSATTTTATTAPSPTTTDSATLGPTQSPTTPSPAPIPSLDSLVDPASGALAVAGISVNHHVMARVEDHGLPAAYLPVDDVVLGAAQFQAFRVRFQIRNAGTEPVIVTPKLQYRPSGGEYAAVPVKPEPGVPLHTSREWIPGPGGGTIQGPLQEDLAVADLLTVGEVGDTAVVGHHSMSANPDLPITLPPTSFTEQEFTVTLSVDAMHLIGYDLRLTDGETPLPGTDVAQIRLGEAPVVQLSPGQRQGVTVENPAPTSPVGSTYPLLTEPESTAVEVSAAVSGSGSAPSAALYPLESGSLSPAVVAPTSVSAAVVGTDTPVVESSNTHGQCAACHRGHSAKAPDLTTESQQSTLCFSCHNSAGASTGAKNIKTPYDLQPLANPNNPTKREYYSHEVISTTPEAARPSACADCHNSHKATATDSVQTADVAGTTGWSASGRLAGVSGVSVVNGPKGESPTLTVLDGVIEPVTLEYQLCFKCHAGADNLLDPIPGKPSMDRLDKGVEFNPSNDSFHPIEAAGKNQTAKMDLSLAGTSPYKMWNFNSQSTIRCLNCHATGTTSDTTTTPLPMPGSALAPHTSTNRGILLKNYLDRELKPRVDSLVDTDAVKAAYSAGDFALCYVCHGEESFAPNGTSDATNFSLHSKHLTGLAERGNGGTDIDAAGDGQGNATCAECHFRTHSTTDKVGEPGGSRLVKFAPNVQPVSGPEPVWTPGIVDTPGTASCTLTCHGYTHAAVKY